MTGLRLPTLLRRHRGYAAFAITTIATAVGANLIVFTIVNALWLRPLPFPDAERLVTLPRAVGTSVKFVEDAAGPGSQVAGQMITDSRYSVGAPVTLEGIGRDLEVLAVTANYFRLLGLRIRGRDFTNDDDREGAEPVAIISDRLWAREFDRRREIIGAVIPGRPVSIRIIGVAPANFDGARRGERGDVWIPMTCVPRLGLTSLKLNELPMMMFVRLAPDRSAAELERRLLDKHTKGRATPYFNVAPLEAVFGTPWSPTIVIREGSGLGVAGGLALLVLVGGCAALAALVIVHYERRRLELAVRTALGASRGRLVGALMRELAIIGVVGTASAMLLSEMGLRAVPALRLPGGVELSRLDLSIDWRVFGFAVAVTLVTLLAATSLPVLRFTRGKRATELFAGAVVAGSVSTQRLRQALLGVLAGATVIVLVTAGLFVRTVLHGFRDATGFDVDRTIFVAAQLMSPRAVEPNSALAVVAERTARVRDALLAVPGVERVAYGPPPIDPEALDRLQTPVTVESRGRQQQLRLGRLDGTPELLSTLGVPILSGRALTAADGTTVPTPAVITSSAASRIWPSDNPIGQIASTSWRGGPIQVVGIAADFVFGSLARPADGVVITGRGQLNLGIEPWFVVRPAHPHFAPHQLERAVKDAVPAATWVKVSTGREIIARDLSGQQLGAWVFSGFGLTALLLGVGSLFGLVAYVAESKKREFGVRLALGATASNLIRHGMTTALLPVASGAAAGLLLAAFLTRLLASRLAGLNPLDPFTYAAVAVTIMVTATLAALIAAWRVRRLVPTDVLRAQ